MALQNLSLQERIQLVEAIWDSIVQEQSELEIMPWQREILDKRLNTKKGPKKDFFMENLKKNL